ncbi:MAG: phosphoglycerate kinase [Dehalococcoidia bacterium]|nr:phosphoglycerate kinase [Dehalococcoidia bacterium]MDZ4247501.1 phosphoglycerate kinase [Dehalococcoidia bacterium]
MNKLTVKDIDVTGKRVLVRVDFNVPVGKDGSISDDTRIRASLPTIEYLIKKRCRIVLCSHFDRPDGKVVESMRLAPVAKRLSELLGVHVEALKDCIGPEVEAAVSKLRDGEIALLENVRFHPGEESNKPEFALALSRLADVYVNDAFGASHRSHASVVGVAQYLPAVSGFLMEKEIDSLGGALENPERPFAVVVGGAKVSGKLGVLDNVIDKVNLLLIGGGMVATFLKSRGYGTGSSLVENDKLDYVRRLAEKASLSGVKLLLPVDLVVAEKLEAGSDVKVVPAAGVPENLVIADIGPETIEQYSRELKACKTVVWNGPMGVFEVPEFARGTRGIAEIISNLKAKTIIGGGSTAEAVNEMGLDKKMYHVSTGGGASLEFLEGKVLPGVAALRDK